MFAAVTIANKMLLSSCGRILRQQPTVLLREFGCGTSSHQAVINSVQQTLLQSDRWPANSRRAAAGRSVVCYALGPQRSRPPGAQEEVAPLIPAIELIVGPMFAGKSTELLRRVRHLEGAGHDVVLVKSKKDDRYHTDRVVTHDGLHRACESVETLADFRNHSSGSYQAAQVIAVDEAQFFPDLLDFCTHAADRDAKLVLVAGLDGDFRRRQFGQVLELMPVADSVTKLAAECKFCKRAAHFSLRIAADERQEVVGGADKYAPVCRRHYVELNDTRT